LWPGPENKPESGALLFLNGEVKVSRETEVQRKKGKREKNKKTVQKSDGKGDKAPDCTSTSSPKRGTWEKKLELRGKRTTKQKE